VNPSQTFRVIHASEHHTRPGDPLLKPANVKLGPSARARSVHVGKRQGTNQSNTRDTAFVAAWEPCQRCGHVQRLDWLGRQPSWQLSCQSMPTRRCRSASAPPISTWIAITGEVMGWGNQAVHEHEARKLGNPLSGTPLGSWMTLLGSRSGWGGVFCPLIERKWW